ncbi:hypothetical protein J1N51_06180 [Psychrosphaera ytuae]|uniref:Uncharacterized protein n=1 Tax=Psychrosphaera ytuae TaxID=2820710 RepID=A0A975DDQ6_9GAMM|nr:hypothetical protein [Psychrosphaera ytuae]QTH65028.1 hypothetical protein J1N51_06180 [Psychrosphaera ytuae]
MELSFKNRRRLVAAKIAARQSLPPIPDKASLMRPFIEYKTRLTSFWHSLNTPQRLYLTPTLLVILMFFADIDFGFSTLALLSIMVVVGLCLEFWPKFLRLWDSLIGKTLILTFYAILANFALASSGGLVNEVTGVSSDALPYSHNIALVLHVPSWFILTTMLSLLSISLLMPVYLIFLLILKPFGIHGLWHPPHYKYVFSTALIRYVWVWILLAVIATYAGKVGFINQTTPFVGHVIEGFTEDHDDLPGTDISPQDVASDDKTNSTDEYIAQISRDSEQPLTEEQEAAIRISIEENKKLADELSKNSEGLLQLMKFLVASFVYHFEADSYSRCEHTKDVRVVELNDYEILTIKQDAKSDVYYTFAVIACKSPGIGQN